jgi:hypothetical protein
LSQIVQTHARRRGLSDHTWALRPLLTQPTSVTGRVEVLRRSCRQVVRQRSVTMDCPEVVVNRPAPRGASHAASRSSWARLRECHMVRVQVGATDLPLLAKLEI